MALDINDIIRAFEPILYFADGERFFPSDCKRYLERSALWNALPPFDDNDSWRRNAPGTFPQPLFYRRALSARSDEPGQFLGERQGGALPFLFATGTDEGFLDLTGWTDGPSVTPKSTNRFANLDEIETLYNSSSPTAGDPLLHGSRFWYHAEVFDLPRLRRLMSAQDTRAHLKEMFPRLLELTGDASPMLLCYYLFFPAHDEPLDECEDVAEAAMFGSYAGEWACVSILLRHGTISSDQGWAECVPLAIGLSSRNVGDVGLRSGERRVGMVVHPWDASVQTVTSDRGPGRQEGLHARLFVAKGTHGLYLRESFLGEEMPFFSPEDSARVHCGAAELLDKSLEDLDDEANAKSDDVWVDDSWVLALKALVNLVWAGVEFIAGGGGGFNGVGTRTPTQFDHPPMRDAPEYFSTIIHPAGVIPPKGEKARTFSWQFPLSNEAALETNENNRTYSMRVDRTNQDDRLRQVWWPGIEGFLGYGGRWGTRVARDPKGRRAGMKFPEFWELFMSALAKSKGA
jgi:hypothetical protein